MNRSPSRSRVVAATLAILLLAGAAGAIEPAVPMETQAAIISNLWQLDRNFRPHSDTVVLGVVYQSKFRKSLTTATDLSDAFKRGRLPVRCVLLDLSDDRPVADQLMLDGVDAVYLAPLRAADVTMLIPILRARHVRTVTAVDEYVTAGAAVGLSLRGDHAQIVINLSASRAEGADFSARLLNIARVIR
jgi:hypothetical protein